MHVKERHVKGGTYYSPRERGLFLRGGLRYVLASPCCLRKPSILRVARNKLSPRRDFYLLAVCPSHVMVSGMTLPVLSIASKHRATLSSGRMFWIATTNLRWGSVGSVVMSSKVCHLAYQVGRYALRSASFFQSAAKTATSHADAPGGGGGGYRGGGATGPKVKP